MTAITPSELRDAFERAKAEAAAIREARKELSGIAKGLPKGTDWPELRALAVAADADEHDEDKRDRVSKLLGKGAYATWYAEILRLRPQNEQNPRFVHKPALAVVPQSDPVTCPPVRQQPDGAAVSNGPAPPSDTAATISDESAAELLDPIALIADHLEPVPSVSPRAEHDGGALPVPHTPLGDAPTNCDDFNDIRGTPFDRNRVEAV